jgi:hypothetical protein
MKSNTSTTFYIIGIFLSIIGILFSITIVGAIIGIPLLILGLYLLREANKLKIEEMAEKRAFDEENAQRIKRAIADGIAEGLRKARDAESNNNIVSKNKTDR